MINNIIILSPTGPGDAARVPPGGAGGGGGDSPPPRQEEKTGVHVTYYIINLYYIHYLLLYHLLH